MPAAVGRYQLLGPLGVGGMASVYLANAQGAAGFEREVALKVLHPHLLTDKNLVHQFLAEGRVCARIRHPNVVPVIDVAEDDANVYLVMEFIEGDTLSGLRKATRKSGNGLPPRIWLRLLCDALAGLHASHELAEPDGTPLGLVHRDFSPQNILVGLDGVARLSDFGIAKLTATPSQTVSGVVKGKINYMAPEQVRGDVLDRRCDVWAAGVLAWEMVTGRRLRASREDNVQTLLEIVESAPPRVNEVAPDFSPEVAAVIDGALTLDRDERWPSAGAFRRALLDAAPSVGGVAEHEECAEWVKGLSAEKIKERREAMGQVKQLRDQLQSLLQKPASESTSLPVKSPVATAASESLEPTQETHTTSALESREHAAPKRGVLTKVLVVAAVLGAGALGVVLVTRGPADQSAARTDRSAEPSNAAPSNAAPSAVATTTIPPTLSATSSAIDARPSFVTLRANEPIASVTLDGREVAIEQRAKELRVQYPEWAVGRSELKVDATSTTGSRASAFWRNGEPVVLEFPKIANAAAAPAPKAKPAPGKKNLAENPY
ncbi:MAG: serine/threonine-protein kinase [Polyangiaceae bacterium]